MVVEEYLQPRGDVLPVQVVESEAESVESEMVEDSRWERGSAGQVKRRKKRVLVEVLEVRRSQRQVVNSLRRGIAGGRLYQFALEQPG